MVGHTLYEDDIVQIGFSFVATCECGKPFQKHSVAQVLEAHRRHVHVEEARALLPGADHEKGDA